MIIEAGKYYRTRDGRKAFVTGRSPFDSTDRLYLFIGFIDGESDSVSWGVDGIFADSVGSDDDLVAEWVDPPTAAELAQAIREHFVSLKAESYDTSTPTFAKILRLADAAIAASK